MTRYFIFLSYDGSRYHGWQVQPNAVSVQGCLQEALSTLLRRPTPIVGAGRTDTGVHARLMAAHFDHEGEQPLDTAHLSYKLSRLLPPDIGIIGIVRMKPEAHARFDAVQRTYHYYLTTAHSPFLRAYSHRVYKTPDFALMNQAAERLLSVRDFTSFSKLHTDVKTNNCAVTHAAWEQLSPVLWRFSITADRFLRNMVRATVGTLLDVGLGKLTVEDFAAVLEARNRCAAGDSVPGHALFLVDVVYPESLFEGGVCPDFLKAWSPAPPFIL